MCEGLRLVIVTEYNLLGECLTLALLTVRYITVVGVTADAARTMSLLGSDQPEVALIDADLANIGAVELSAQIKLRFPNLSIIFIGAADPEKSALECVAAGADAYLVKDASLGHLLSALHSAHQQETVGDPQGVPLVFSRLAKLTGHLSGRRFSELLHLTPRELEVLRLIAEGQSNKQIAQQLGLSLHTVKNHVHNILEKLHMHNRLQMVRYALDNGLIFIGHNS